MPGNDVGARDCAGRRRPRWCGPAGSPRNGSDLCGAPAGGLVRRVRAGRCADDGAARHPHCRHVFRGRCDDGAGHETLWSDEARHGGCSTRRTRRVVPRIAGAHHRALCRSDARRVDIRQRLARRRASRCCGVDRISDRHPGKSRARLCDGRYLPCGVACVVKKVTDGAVVVRRLLLLIALCICVFPGRAQERAAPIVILISFDGWRWDYMARTHVPNLQELASRGVRAEALIPVFPTKTFPNHYTIVTGLYPENHGIVSNVIADPAYPRRFTMSAQTANESRWWGGEPVWVTAMRHQQRSAAMFWPGSDVAIAGVRPTYWRRFDDGVSNAARIRQVLQWLALPDGSRPSL